MAAWLTIPGSQCRALCTSTTSCNAYYSESNPLTDVAGVCELYTRGQCTSPAAPNANPSGDSIYLSAGAERQIVCACVINPSSSVQVMGACSMCLGSPSQ